MAEPELFVICPNCGSEVSPYVTECPYCGNRLRKRAPDLKKDRKQREKAEKKAEKEAEKRRRRTKSLLTGRGGDGGTGGRWGGGEAGALPDYLETKRAAPATALLVAAAVVLSVASRAGGFPPDDWTATTSIADQPWVLFTAPFFSEGLGYAFVCLLSIAMFGSGLERRFGSAAVVAIWLVCGAAGVAAEHLMVDSSARVGSAIVTVDITANGAIAISVGMMTAWLIHVLNREDLRDFDPFGLVAVSAVLFAMPLVSDEASVWMIFGGLLSGAACGAVLLLRTARG